MSGFAKGRAIKAGVPGGHLLVMDRAATFLTCRLMVVLETNLMGYFENAVMQRLNV